MSVDTLKFFARFSSSSALFGGGSVWVKGMDLNTALVCVLLEDSIELSLGIAISSV
jgi:hypothetical protein